MIPRSSNGTDSFEVEVKYRLADPEALRQRLATAGYQRIGRDEQEDVYLRHPERDFAQTREAFRLRRHGAQNFLTYKGPKQAGPTKTREEIELGFEAGATAWAGMLRLLERLGFSPVAAVAKHREQFAAPPELGTVMVVIDRVDGLGDFAEVEALADGPEKLPDAQATVLQAAAWLGLDQVEPRSYLRMVLEHARKSSGPA